MGLMHPAWKVVYYRLDAEGKQLFASQWKHSEMEVAHLVLQIAMDPDLYFEEVLVEEVEDSSGT